jgi:hypothetical protein
MQYDRCSTICNLIAGHSDSAPAAVPTRRHDAKSIVVVWVVSLLLLLLRPSASRRRLLGPIATRCLESPFCWCPMLVTESSEEVVYLTCFEVVPSPHSDLAAVELALILQTGLLRLLTSRLTCVTPAEVVKLPEGVSWEDKVPDRK